MHWPVASWLSARLLALPYRPCSLLIRSVGKAENFAGEPKQRQQQQKKKKPPQTQPHPHPDPHPVSSVSQTIQSKRHPVAGENVVLGDWESPLSRIPHPPSWAPLCWSCPAALWCFSAVLIYFQRKFDCIRCCCVPCGNHGTPPLLSDVHYFYLTIVFGPPSYPTDREKPGVGRWEFFKIYFDRIFRLKTLLLAVENKTYVLALWAEGCCRRVDSSTWHIFSYIYVHPCGKEKGIPQRHSKL